MKARFDVKMKINAAGRKLEACGPLDWNDPDGPQGVNRVVITVTISQNQVLAEGSSGELDNTMQEWMINLRPDPGQKFQTGTAQARGTLTVIDPPAPAQPEFSWDGEPDLDFDVADG